VTDTVDMRRLTKSRSDRMIDGVCGGIAAYAGVDATLVRLGMLVLVFFGGLGVLLYLLAMIIMPKGPETPGPVPASVSRVNSRFWGILLVVMGMILLGPAVGVAIWPFLWGLSWGVVLPVLLIIAGVTFLFGGRAYVVAGTPQAAPAPAPQAAPAPPPPPRKLYRSRGDRKLVGVCGGFGEYLRLDATIIRLMFVVAAFASLGLAVLVYLVAALVVPAEPAGAVQHA